MPRFVPTAGRPTLALSMLGLIGLALIACRQPSAELTLPEARGAEPSAEPSGRGGPAVFVEAPAAKAAAGSTVELDWRSVDTSLSNLVEGERYRVDYGSAHPFTGAAEPLVTIVVFSDYQCPYCARLDATLNQLLVQYSADVRVVYRQFPLPMHREARFAAQVALAAHDRGLFAPIHEWLYANGRNLDRASVGAELQRLGLDPQLVFDEIDAGVWDQAVDADMEFAARFGVRATPSFFVNGRSQRGALPVEDIEALIREEQGAAERLIAAGAPRREVWARMLAASTDQAPQPAGAAATPTPSAPQPIATSQRFPTAVKGLPQRGPKNAKIELLMCSDFDCPFCARATATIEQLVQNHPKDLAVFFRHHPLPMHPNARAAHRAAVAADNQGEFWAMYELLFANSKQRSEAELEDMAKQIGLDLKRFRKDVADPKTDTLIDQQADYCQKDLTATGTPTFFVNGRKIVGARPLADFEAVINEELNP